MEEQVAAGAGDVQRALVDFQGGHPFVWDAAGMEGGGKNKKEGVEAKIKTG